MTSGGNNINDFPQKSTHQISCKHTGMLLLSKEVTVWFLPVQESAGMAYRPTSIPDYWAVGVAYPGHLQHSPPSQKQITAPQINMQQVT